MCAAAAALLIPAVGEAHKGAWASHSVRQAGGPADARSFAGCNRLNRARPAFSAHRCKHKVYWDRKYRELSDADKGWLFRTRLCESTDGADEHSPGNRYHGRYQYWPPTAWSAGYRDPRGHYFDPHRVYPHEDDVRTVRWRNRAGAGQWPQCG